MFLFGAKTMSLKFPKTYDDLKKAPYISDIEISESGVFLYIEERFLPNSTDYTAWGEKNLKQALQMLRNDFWRQIKENYMEQKK